MTVRYVGSGGSDSNDGLSWANRKLTLNGVEDTPVAAGDIVYVGPGVYRESLTADVAGSSGNPIVYIGDVLGENTDGIGGVVRITGSDNDLSATRSTCITLPNARSYRTFRGFMLDSSVNSLFSAAASSDAVIVEDCFFQAHSNTAPAAAFNGTGAGCIVRRCVFITAGPGVQFIHTATVNDTGNLIENCAVLGSINQAGFRVDRVGGITIKNSLVIGCANFLRVQTALAAGQTVTVNNCISLSNNTGLVATATGEITEDYNAFWANNTLRSNTDTGANSVTAPPLFDPILLRSGFRMPWSLFNLSEWSTLAHRAGAGEADLDLFGIERPATSAKKSWGPVQDVTTLRETTTVRSGVASMKVPDAGRVQMIVPVSGGVGRTISVYVRREADYAGTNPQMIIREAGQADRTTTDAGSSGAWNQLTDTFTPQSNTDFVTVLLVSNNTATSGSYAVYFDDLS